MSEIPTAAPSQETAQSAASAPAAPKVAGRMRYMILDQLLRWAWMGLWQQGVIPEWLFWTLQVGQALAFCTWAETREGNAKRRLGVPNIEMETSGPVDLALLSCVIVGIVGFELALAGHSLWLRIPAGIFMFVLLVGYEVGFLTAPDYDSLGSTGAPKPKTQEEETYESRVLLIDPQLDGIDKNDLVIVNLETDVTSARQRIDAYIIESVLFGALAFGAFVQLVAGDGINKVVSGYGQLWWNALSDVARWEFAEAAAKMQPLTTDSYLYTALLYENLWCSMFFLSVIASRLRASSMLDNIARHVANARAFNQKEEELALLQLQHETGLPVCERVSQRLRIIGERVAAETRFAGALMPEIQSLLGYMLVFRMLGLGTFIVVVITGSLMLSSWLATVFFVLSIIAISYTGIDRLLRAKRFRKRFNAVRLRRST